MKKIMSKSGLAVALSYLGGFKEPKVKDEQYITDSEVGASILWNAYLLGDIKGKVITDLGCGTGILGIGALLLGAKSVYLIDFDSNALKIAKNNILKVKSEGYSIGEVEFITKSIKDIKIKSGIVLENPPFGTKIKHNDMIFLEKAMTIAPITYSLHKSESKAFLERFSAKNNVKITHIWDFKFPIKASFAFHRRQIHRIDVSCFRFETSKDF